MQKLKRIGGVFDGRKKSDYFIARIGTLLFTSKAMTTAMIYQRSVQRSFSKNFKQPKAQIACVILLDKVVDEGMNQIFLVVNPCKSGDRFILLVFCNFKQI